MVLPAKDTLVFTDAVNDLIVETGGMIQPVVFSEDTRETSPLLFDRFEREKESQSRHESHG